MFLKVICDSRSILVIKASCLLPIFPPLSVVRASTPIRVTIANDVKLVVIVIKQSFTIAAFDVLN